MTDYDLTPTAIRDALGPFGEGLDDEAAVEMYARVAWSHVAEPGDADAGALIGALGPAVALDTVASSVPTPVGELDGLAARHAWARWRPRLDGDAVFRSLRAAHRIGAMLITPAASDWPESLNDLGAHAPVAVWVRGTVDAWRSTAVAIVGARAATSYGEHVAADLAAGIGAYGGAVVSGAAYGVDGAAHRAALAVGSPTVAFLAGGVDRAYPRGNSALIERIAEVGALVSELPPGAAPTKWRFLQRNRLIAALGAATVVVEAGAVSLGRPLGAVPGPVTSAASAGCHRLLREYDAVAVTGADDAWELVGRLDAREVERADGAMGGPRTDAATRVVDALSTRAGRSTDEAARGAGLSVAETGSLLGLLELEGRVRRDDRGWRRA